MTEGVWFNKDGLRVHYGNRKAEHKIPAVPNELGYAKSHELSFGYQDLIDADIGTPGQTVLAGSSDRSEVFPIPSGAVITAVYLRVKDAFATGTGLEAGLEQLDGTAIDVDGLFDELSQGAVANLTANTTVVGETTLVGTVLTANGYLRLRWVGTAPTAGSATLIVQYNIHPLEQAKTV